MFWVSGFLSLLKHESAALFSRSGLCRVVVSLFRGCVKVLSVLGWFIVTSLGGLKLGHPNFLVWNQIYSATTAQIHCCFKKRPGLMGIGSGTGLVIGQFYGT